MMRFKTVTRFASVLATTLLAMFLITAAAEAKLGVPHLVSPRAKAVVPAFPAFTWRPVRKAGGYQIEISPNRSFSAGEGDITAGAIGVYNDAFTNAQPVPNGTYYWRVRAVTTANAPGRWSRIWKLVKRWNTAPKLLTPGAGTRVNWPSSPPLLKWSAVPYAVNYQLTIGTTPALANPVYGPTNVQGPQFVVPTTLIPGTYYWAVRPIDAAGNLGRMSAVHAFSWSWSTSATLNEADASPDSTYQEPSFTWSPIPGASSYEVQVATDPSYAANSIIVDAAGLATTSFTESKFYPNHTTLYWRVRAIDSRGDAGSWNDGESFTELFDQPTPQNFHNVTASGAVDDGASTVDPILRWSPVPGASSYLLSFAPWSSGTGCNFNAQTPIQSTSNTAWTPGGWPPGATEQNAVSMLASYAAWQHQEYEWTSAALSGNDYLMSGGAWCVSLVAVRSDPPLAGSTIESAPTILGSFSQPAFNYTPAPATGTLTSSDVLSPNSVEVVPPAYGSGPQGAGSTMTTTPLFQWQPVAHADGYYVVIANDEGFDPNSIVTGGFTNTTAWAPPIPLPDQTGSFWWEVIPVSSTTANGVPQANATNGQYNPQDFNKNSTPPSPIGPIAGSNVAGEPTFAWHSTQGAVSYTLEISSDPSFASPIETDTVDTTQFTTGVTLPSHTTLYWRVRANDVGYALNWSAAQTFTHNLSVPSPLSSTPKSGSTLPLIAWTPISGATSYNVQLTNAGNTSTVSTSTPYLTTPEFFGQGVTKWQVQSVFPGGALSSYSSPATYSRKIPPPRRIRASKHGSRILVTWRPDPIAKAYNVELSTSSEFSAPIVNTTTTNTAWVPNISPQQGAVKLYWRVAAIDDNGILGSYHTGVFRHRR